MKYDSENLDDEYSGLADQPIDPEEFESLRIDTLEFENIWNRI